jgi:VanZ family protein
LLNVLSRLNDNSPPNLRLAARRRRDVRDAGAAALSPAFHLGQDGEHALAFVLIGLAFGLAYRQHRLLTSVISVVMIGALELLQLWVPGRHARLEDFIVDALAACVGFAVAAAMDWARLRLLWNDRAS